MKTLVLLYPGCIEFEIMLACEISNQVFPTEVITPDGADHVGSNGMTIKSSGSIESIDPTKYKVVLLPGGNPDALVGNLQLNEKLRALHESGCVLGAICAGPVLLEQAGLLKGSRVAHGYEEFQFPFLRTNGFFVESELTDDSFVVHGRVVTARPDAYIDFALQIAILSGAVTQERAALLRTYYRGPN